MSKTRASVANLENQKGEKERERQHENGHADKAIITLIIRYDKTCRADWPSTAAAAAV